VVVAASSPIRSVDGLAGARVGAIAGSTNMRLAATLGAAELVEFDGSSADVFAEMLDAVSTGRIDAMVDDMPAFGGVLAAGRFRLVHVACTANPWGAACRLGDEETVALINGGLATAIDDGSLAGEWSRWFPDQAVPPGLRPGG